MAARQGCGWRSNCNVRSRHQELRPSAVCPCSRVPAQCASLAGKQPQTGKLRCRRRGDHCRSGFAALTDTRLLAQEGFKVKRLVGQLEFQRAVVKQGISSLPAVCDAKSWHADPHIFLIRKPMPAIDLSRYNNSDFDRGASRWKEALWVLLRAIFFLNPLPWPSAFRVGLLRLFGAQIGQRVVIRSQANVSFPWRLRVGDDVWIGDEVFILSLADVTIESSVCLSQRAFLCTGSHDFRSPAFGLITRPIIVRTGSWIAASAFVAPGVEIGAGAVVSAGGVVLRNVAPDTLVGGNPAQLVKKIDRANIL
jgi:putative colanic acid biosynthesis acetyltransferase WcaF